MARTTTVWLFAFVLALGMFACGGSSGGGQATTPRAEEAPAEPAPSVEDDRGASEGGEAPAAAPAPAVSPPPAGGATSQNAIAELTSIRDEACACQDRGCGENALGRFADTFHKFKSAPAAGTDYDQIKQLSANITKCLMGVGITAQEVMDIFKK